MRPSHGTSTLRLFALLLAGIMVTAPLALLAPVGPVHAQPGEGTKCPMDGATPDRTKAFWISDVKITSSSSGAWITEEGAVFLPSTGSFRAHVTIQNRVDNNSCYLFLTGAGADNPYDNIRVDYLYEENQADWIEITDAGCNTPLGRGESCTVTTRNILVADQAGEHRLRFRAGDADGSNDFEVFAGAERVIVVDQRPDVQVTDFVCVSPLDDNGDCDLRTTASQEEQEAIFDVTVANVGDYPTWNPNGGDPAVVFGRGSFDAPTDDDAEPEDFNVDWHTRHAIDGDYPAPDLPPCRNQDDWVRLGESGTPRCNYKRGAPLPLAFRWELAREGDTTPMEVGEDMSWAVAGDLDDQRWDKNTTLPHASSQVFDVPLILDPVHAGNTEAKDGAAGAPADGDPLTSERTFRVETFDLFNKAGDYELTIEADRSATDTYNAIDELDGEDNNDHTESLEVLGVNLKLGITSWGVLTQGPDGPAVKCGVTASDPCPAGKPIVITGIEYENDGEVDTLDKTWRAAVLLGGKIARNFDNPDEEVFQDQNGVPSNDGGTNPVEPFGDRVRIETNQGGGVHIIRVALDHPHSYTKEASETAPNLGTPDPDEGIIAEMIEENTCPEVFNLQSPGPNGILKDNIWCMLLFFADEQAPEIEGLTVDPVKTDTSAPDGIIKVREGERVFFNATVRDNSLANVTALLGAPNGSIEELEMSAVEGEQDLFSAVRTFTNENVTGIWTYNVTADDGDFGNVNTTEVGVPFNVTGLPKRIEQVNVLVNGASSFTEEEAPTYRGTADQADNWFNITASISETGRDEPDPTGKLAQLYAPNGTLAANFSMQAYTVCERQTVPGGQQASQGEGDDCAADQTGPNGEEINSGDPTNNEPAHEIVSRSTHWYVNTSEADWADEPKAGLPFVGEFTIAVAVNDTFERWNSTFPERTVRINDVPAPLILEDVSISPTTFAAGTTITASATAGDGLRVERVFLEIVNQRSGDTKELDLDFQEESEDEDTETARERRNGTWAGTFSSGAFKDFDQAGPYEVTFHAVDFANTTESVEAPEVELTDTQAPQITELFTIPPDAVEVGDVVSFEARIQDDTAVMAPVLTLTRPASGTQTFEMTFQEDTGRWNLSLATDPADIGTWSFTLDVEDWAGNADSKTGEVRVATNLPPRAQNWAPNVVDDTGKVWGPERPTIRVDVIDVGSGVDEGSIEVTVNGVEVTDSVQKSPITNGFRLAYTPSSAFDHGETVTVQVTAADNTEGDPQVTDPPLSHQFEVDAAAPSVEFTAEPSLTQDGQQVIGLITDLNLTTNDPDSGPGPLTVTVQHLSGNTATAQQTLEFEEGEASFRLDSLESAFQGHGNYRLLVTATDAVGNTGNQLQFPVLYDKSPPKVRPFAQPGEPREHVFADITDDSSVKDAWIKYTPEDGETETVSMNLTDDGIWEGQIPAFPRNTTINFTVEAEDFFGNVGSSPPDSFRAGDAVPTITLTKPTDGAVVEGTTEITWTASDLETPARDLKVSLYYKKAGEDFRAIPDGQNLENVGRYMLDTTGLPNGRLTLQAIVFDGNNFGDSKVEIQVRNLARIFNDPRIDGVRAADGRNLVSPNQDLTFKVDIDGDVRKAWANVTHEGQPVLSVPLESAGQGTWEGSFQAPADPGDYGVDLTALTGEGEVTTENAYTFTVQSAEDGNSFVSEWTILTILFAAALGVGIVGVAQRWK